MRISFSLICSYKFELIMKEKDIIKLIKYFSSKSKHAFFKHFVKTLTIIIMINDHF